MVSTFTTRWSAKAMLLIASITCAFALSACASDPHGRSMGRTVDDTWISSKVKSTLLADDLVNGTAIEVETYRGKVMLSGFVETQNQIERAVEITKKIDGVQQVVNHLEIKGNAMGQRESGQMGESERRQMGEMSERGNPNFQKLQ